MLIGGTPPDEGCITGKGNSPPLRKLAGLPLVVSRFGSARISANCRVTNILMVAPRLRSDRKRKMFSASESVNVVVVTPFEVLGTRDGGLYCCVPTLPIVFVAPVLNRFKPKSELGSAS